MKYVLSLPLFIVGLLTAWEILPIDSTGYHIHIGVLASLIGLLFLVVYDHKEDPWSHR